MAAPYSYDLRQKVLEAIDKGMRKSEASRVFNLSRNTIDLWLKRRETTGDYKAIQGYQAGSRHRITDWEKFREFVKKNGDKTQAEMAEAWTEQLSRQTIGRGLKKMGLTRKKKRMVTEKEMKTCGKNFRTT